MLTLDTLARGRRAALDVGVGVLVVLVLWLPQPAGGPGAAVWRIALASLVVASCGVRWLVPRTAAFVAVLVTATAALADLTIDPMVAAAWTLVPLAMRSARRTVGIVLGAALACTLLVSGVLTVPGEGEALRYALVSSFVLAAAWALGTSIRLQRASQAHEHAARAHAAVLDERERLSREVHDALSHTLGVIGVRAGVAAHVSSLDEAALRETLAQIEQSARDATQHLRRALDAPDAADRGTAPSLDDLHALVEDVRDAGTPCTWTCDLGDRRARVDPDVQAAVYRIVQESLTNALRHAPGSHIDVVVRAGTDALHVEVTDGGAVHRTAASDTREGRGLRNIRDRAHALGGWARTGPAEHGGFSVTASLPLEPPARPERPAA